MKTRPLIYIAGPLGQGDKQLPNVHRAIDAADDVTRLGAVVYVPHLSYFWAELKPGRHYEEWLMDDFEVIARCDALFRMEGASPGADREVSFCGSHGIPVIYNMTTAKEWISRWLENQTTGRRR